MPLTRKKLHYEDVSVDRISKLPDEILVQILSHLSTKEAVATTILSKRWEYLWASTSNLDFSDDLVYAGTNEMDRKLKSLIFKQYVNRVIFYCGSSTLQKCRMIFRTSYFSDDIYSWICALITCNIKELRLVHYAFKPQGLPWRLFTCKSLVVLKVYGPFVLDLPAYVCFPSLRVLHLSYVVLLDASIHRFLSSCRVLEDLCLIRVNHHVQVLNISIPSLKILTISCQEELLVLPPAGCYAPVSCTALNSRIEINTPFLEYFQYSALSNCSANMLSSLIRADLDGNVNINLLNAISQVESLALKKYSMQQLICIIDRHSTLPTFYNLKEMKLHISRKFDWRLLLKFLKCTPNLQHLVFPSGLVRVGTNEVDFDRFNWPWFWPEFVPECLSLNVKIIEICNFVGFEGELHLVKYLLEFGIVMEKLIIRRFDFSTKEGMEDRVKDLVDADRTMLEMLSYESGSAACEVVYAA